MERVQVKIGNTKQHLFDVTDPYRVYYSTLGETEDSDDSVLPYGEYIQNNK